MNYLTVQNTLTALACSIILLFTSCTKIKSNPADSVQGTYTGKGRDVDENIIEPITITVSKIDNKTIEVTGTYFDSFTKEIKFVTDDKIVEEGNITGMQYDDHNQIFQFEHANGISFHGIKQ